MGNPWNGFWSVLFEEHGLKAMQKLLYKATVLVMAAVTAATGAEIDGVTMPDSQDIAGRRLVLNGLGLRTYSMLRIHIYVAGLYLTQRSHDGVAILQSDQPKMLRFFFLHDVDAEAARASWREALNRNCLPPCSLAASDLDRFLAAIPSVHAGDTSAILFTVRRVDFFMNARLVGRISNPNFVGVMLSTFIGPKPTSAALKAGLLGISE